MLNLCQNRRVFFSDRMTVKFDGCPKNNREHLLCNSKLCASFRSHLWIQTGVTVRKHPDWGTICFDFCELDLWPLTLTFCMDIAFINGDKSWKFHDDTMTGTLWKRSEKTDRHTDGQTDRQTDRQMDRSVLKAAWSQLKIEGTSAKYHLIVTSRSLNLSYIFHQSARTIESS